MPDTRIVPAMQIAPLRALALRWFVLMGALLIFVPSGEVSAQSIGEHPLPVRGSELAPVEIIQIAGFECPYSAKAQSTIKEIARRYPKHVRHVFFHLPLPFHDQSLQSALASTVAQREGKFWEFADTFFAEQDQLSTAHTRRVAQRHDIAVETINEGINRPEAQSFIDQSKAVANALRINGTPNFFINGTLVRGQKPLSAFKTIIEIEIAMAGKEPLTKESAAAYRQKRTKSNNLNLHAYLYSGKVPPQRLNPEEAALEEEPDPGPDDEQLYQVLIREADAYLGDPKKALVTLVSFVSYQCKHSRELMKALEEVKAHYGDEVALVLKHLPLSIHPLGREAAVNAICAQEQERFWAFNHELFSSNHLSDIALEGKARKAGVDVAAMKACADAGKVRKQIREDGILAQRVGARGTPTTYINGRQVVGSMPTASLMARVEAELVRIRKRVEAGEAVEAIYPSLMETAHVLEPLEERVFDVDVKSSPLRGRHKAPVNVTVFFDYQCPYSAKLEASLQEIYQRYAGRVSVSVKHFPLTIHKNAEPAARAAYCAFQQGKFWPMHDTLSARSEPLTPEMVESTALTIGLDPLAFEACKTSIESSQAVAADIAQGKKIGLTGTPTLLINGRRYDLSFGGQADDLAQTIDRLLEAPTEAP